MIEKIHHVGVVVRDIDQAMRFWRDTLGLAVRKTQRIDEQGVEAALMTAGDSEIELIQPTVTDNGVARYLESRGEGLHHVCFQVESVDADLESLKAQGVEMIDQTPRIGIAGRICFLHPKSLRGTLVELCEPPDRAEGA